MIREFGLSIKFRWSGGGKKRFVRGLGQAENKINWLSEVSDEQKTRKNGFPRSRMNRKRRKSTFGRARRVKNDKNSVSAMAESLKMKKNAFRPWPKNEKRQKQHFGHGRS